MTLRPYLLQAIKRIVGPRMRARHSELSIVSSVDDGAAPSKRLISVSLTAIAYAQKLSLKRIPDRRGGRFVDVWPGEHYKLLAGIVSATKPKIIVEIGTAQGVSALAMRTALPARSTIHTFDIVPWNTLLGTSFTKNDFSDDRIVQHLGDLSDERQFLEHAALLRSADLIFIDAAKDGVFEYRLWELMCKHGLKRGAILVWDDTRLWEMLRFWRNVQMPKLDLTSFGHWCGTGLVEWVPGK